MARRLGSGSSQRDLHGDPGTQWLHHRHPVSGNRSGVRLVKRAGHGALFDQRRDVGPLAPFVGKAADRFGARNIGLVGIVLFVLAYLGIGLLSSANFPAYLAVWFVASLLLAPAGVITWTLGVANRFTAQRGLALAAVLYGTSLMGAIAAPVAGAILETAG